MILPCLVAVGAVNKLQMNDKILFRNNVVVRGQGRVPILFAHGFGCHQGMWRFVTPAFEPEHKVVLFDYVGAGRSDIKAYNAERYNDLNGYAEDIIEVCDGLDLKKFIFVGHSVSGMIGLLAAIKRPDLFATLVLVAPSPRYISDPPDYPSAFELSEVQELLATMEQNYIGWAKKFGPQMMQNPEQPELGAELTASFCATNPTIARQFAKVTFLSDNRSDLPKLHIPSLILQCADDLIAPQSVGDYVHHHIPGSTLVRLTATGHCPHLSAPQELITAIREYMLQGAHVMTPS